MHPLQYSFKNKYRLKDTVAEAFLRLLMKYEVGLFLYVLFLTIALIKGIS